MLQLPVLLLMVNGAMAAPPRASRSHVCLSDEWRETAFLSFFLSENKAQLELSQSALRLLRADKVTCLLRHTAGGCSLMVRAPVDGKLEWHRVRKL